jgi:hypothetical protein
MRSLALMRSPASQAMGAALLSATPILPRAMDHLLLGEMVYSQVLQDVVLRLKKAFDAYFRRLKAGETPGYPRFRGQGRYNSLTFPQVPVGCALDTIKQRLVIFKVGRIKVILHRPLRANLRRRRYGARFPANGSSASPAPGSRYRSLLPGKRWGWMSA